VNLLLTGATGFLGKHLTRAFLDRGDRVAAYHRGPAVPWEGPQWFQTGIEEDERPFREAGPIDAIVHLATCYGRKGEPISQILQANLSLPLRLARLATQFRVPLFLNTDTYYNRHESGYAFLADYGVSKHHALHWLRRHAEMGDFRLLNLSLEHVYGPGDALDKFCNSTLSTFLRNEPELALTSGEQTRDFIYVADVVSAYVTVLDQKDRIEGKVTDFGVGTGKLTAVRDFVALAHSLSGATTKLRFGALPHRPGEIMESRADNFHLRSLGWEPKTDLKSGLQATLDSLRT
jgi:nucleoside-diphosphate-sugar epimerase